MTSRTLPLGSLIRVVDEKNRNMESSRLLGVNINKDFMPSVANQTNLDLSKYKIVRKGRFACNIMHVGRDEVLPVALYRENSPALVSPAYTTFEVLDESKLNPEYLMLLLQRPEFDRYAWFISDSSVRGGLEWSRFLEVEIPLPSISEQQNYISDVAGTMEDLRTSLSASSANLERVLHAFLDDQRLKSSLVTLADVIEQSDEKNYGLGIEHVRGISINKEFIRSKANLSSVDVSDYKLVHPAEFAYVTVTSRNGEKISIALNTGEDLLVSKTYIVFRIKPEIHLLPEYLMLWFRRPEFDRYARFHSWGSARETFDWSDLQEVAIPIPSVEVQLSIVKILRSLSERRESFKKLSEMQRRISPVLYSGVISRWAVEK